uniref:Transcriptional modulator of MazE/toxin, MazF n=2 Tax=Candidatus Bipolaricaulota TaxID=67810 RepID=H5SML6_9BACT|nr:transcriptional modulator of MazE/toxin, MazF [uncultured Acetothermia bacterium]BAL59784.1 transcriptional modulator of MazE/toxin, MazF [Candidatus Acetothermum autotrophicum]
MLRQREIVLIPVPFTDLTSQKRRPVLIISHDRYNKSHQDIIVVAITSHLTPTDYGVLLEADDLEIGTLPRVSLIRVDKIYTLSQAIVVKVYGRVKPAILTRVRKLLRDLV